jgi:hypothetical protein
MSAAPTRCGVGCGPAARRRAGRQRLGGARRGRGAGGQLQHRADQERPGGIEAVGGRHRVQRDARVAREPAERVAGAHDVGAEHGGRARTRRGRGGAAACGAAVPGEGRGALGHRRHVDVEPRTTCAFSDSPLKAATVRVVRLLAAAIDHNVSPGCTVCETAALAGAAARRRTIGGREENGAAESHDPGLARMPGGAARQRAALRLPASRVAPPMDPQRLKLWAQKWRWYERNSLPWNRARIHLEFARREAFCRWPVTATCSRCCRRGGSSSARTCCSSPACG